MVLEVKSHWGYFDSQKGGVERGASIGRLTYVNTGAHQKKVTHR